ncbi:MAG: tRNA (guanosine(37)-N1)-methyltransferase TrmD [Clostridiaceae bacterium]|nr:tRNA (guanosine(37)-N1)-methyltransferase TrmD [Clostridiaceae bacterium]
MNFHVMTLFPEMIIEAMQVSITGRAIKAGYIQVNAVNIRDYAQNKHNRVDDYPYGGGAGMVMQAEPVYRCFQAVRTQCPEQPEPRVICLSPQGKVFSQEMAQELASESDLIFLCGHYEGIDERVLEEIVTDYVSIGDYVLTGGELPALVIMDAVSRLVPGVLNNGLSAQTESFSDHLLEYPQYTRPEEWRGKKVPSVLLSGNHRLLAEWYREQSVIRTAMRRPDLLEQAELTEQEKEMLEQAELTKQEKEMLGQADFTEQEKEMPQQCETLRNGE